MYKTLKILIVIIFSSTDLQTISHIYKNVHSILLYQISYAYFVRFMNYHQKPECCVKNFHTAAMSCQDPKTAAYLSKIYYHTLLQGMMVLVSMAPYNFVCQPCCYCQLSKTLDTHTHHTNTHTSHTHTHHPHTHITHTHTKHTHTHTHTPHTSHTPHTHTHTHTHHTPHMYWTT